MSGAKQFAANWLMDDIFRAKALIKYEIKQLEIRLQRAMGDGKKARLKTQEAARYCSALARLYEDWLCLISRAPKEEFNLVLAQPEHNASRSYLQIQRLKQQLAAALHLNEELLLVLELKNYYKYLHNQISFIQPQSFSLIQSSLVEKLKILARATTAPAWLFAVVNFANELGENTFIPLTFFTELNDKDLLNLAECLGQEEFVLLINSIFLYQFEPQLLFKQITHPEKLVSVKTRLSMLYHFIEMIHQIVMQILRQRGLNGGHDYLFHGEELPPGIQLKAETSFSDLIISALKEWRLHKMVYPDDLANKNKLNDLFRAYKFWFNPNRLIDALMTLERELIGEELHENYKKLMQHLRAFYHQLSTTECLELYGYFANKDSIYLMRTLAAAMSGQEIPSLPPLNDSEQKIIAKVYHSLDCAMEAIREELLSRHITTAPYVRNNRCKPIKPGRRNLNAIIRVLELYGAEQMTRNLVIEQLFNQLEA